MRSLIAWHVGPAPSRTKSYDLQPLRHYCLQYASVGGLSTVSLSRAQAAFGHDSRAGRLSCLPAEQPVAVR